MRARFFAQAEVPVLADDTEEVLAARVLSQEHRLYPAALAELATDAYPLTRGYGLKPKRAAIMLWLFDEGDAHFPSTPNPPNYIETNRRIRNENKPEGEANGDRDRPGFFFCSADLEGHG